MPTSTHKGVDDLLANLSQVLWRQRTLIELLQYRLEVQQLIMSSGRDKRLARAVEEVEEVMDDIRRLEDLRLAVVRETAMGLGLDAAATLNEIRARANPPWDFVLGEHQTALLALVAEAEETATRNRELAHRGLGDTRALFEQLSPGARKVTAYGPRGAPTTLALPPTMLDRDA